MPLITLLSIFTPNKHPMNTIDIVLGLILLIAFFMGFRKGLLLNLASLVGVFVAVYCAMYFSEYASVYIEKWFDWSANTNRAAAFIVTFLIIMLVFRLLGNLLTKVADFAMLGIFNKILGGAFNTLKWAFIISVVFMFVNSSADYQISTAENRANSILYPPIASLAPAVLPTIMKEVEKLDDENNQINTSQ